MSPNAHIPSHRKPRRSASAQAIRVGVTGGILTLAVAGSTATATAAEPASATETSTELTTVSDTLTSATAQAAEVTEQTAHSYELRARQERAATKARAEAKKTKAEADRKAEEAKAKAEKERKAEAEQQAATRASRSAERTSLTSTATADGGAAPSATSQATGNAATVVNFVRAQLGKPYVLGATGPSSFDCSGLTQAAFSQVGVNLPRVSQDQSATGTQVSLDALQPGDILYWGSSGSASHVAVYVGDGKFVGAQNPSTGVVERDMSYSQPTGAVRVL